MTLYKNRYRAESTRLKDWNYSRNGYYYITICTEDKIKCLGKIVESQVEFSKMGLIVKEYWQNIPEYYPCVKLDEFIIMPDHMHGIIKINHKNHIVFNDNRKNMILPQIINQFKRACTIKIRKEYKLFAWQRNYHDHIIRNEIGLNRVREYIKNNPKNYEQM